MNRFLPWVGGILGVAIVATGGLFAYSSYSDSRSQTNEQTERQEDIEYTSFRQCVDGVGQATFADPAFDKLIRQTLFDDLQKRIPEGEPIDCALLLDIKSLVGNNLGIISIEGIHYLENLELLHLSHNPNIESFIWLKELTKLQRLELYDTGMETEDLLFIPKEQLLTLDVSDNKIDNIKTLEFFPVLNRIILDNNKIFSIKPLLALMPVDGSVDDVISLKGVPLDLSTNSEDRETIRILREEKYFNVRFDNYILQFGFKDTAGFIDQTLEVQPPIQLNLGFQAIDRGTGDFVNHLVEKVNFFQLGQSNSLLQNFVAPSEFLFPLSFSKDDEGKLYSYRAEIRFKNGSTLNTQQSEYASILLKESTPQCRADADCKDNRQCTTDRCVSGKCEHYMQTACSENEETACSDGKDNNKDGKIDCADPDCSGSASCKETICYDGTDNDKDGKIDCRDSDCSIEPTCGEICDNGINDDGDPNVDCNDRRDCAEHPSCQVQAQACNSDVSIVCKEIFAENESQVHCSLRMSIKGSNQCSASIVTCNRDQCWSDIGGGNFNFQGCANLQNKLQTLPVGTVLSGNAALGLNDTQMCGGLNLCRRIILCE